MKAPINIKSIIRFKWKVKGIHWVLPITLLTVLNVESAEYELYPNPVVWYTFDESSGDTIYDHSDNDYHATLNNGGVREDGYITLTTVQRINLPKVETLNAIGNFTMAFDLAIHNLNYEELIFAWNIPNPNGVNYKFGYNSDDQLFLVYADTGTIHQIPFEISDFSFHEYVFVYEDNLVSIYFDKVLVANSISVYNRVNSLYSSGLGYNFPGSFGEFKFFTEALNSHQVKTVFSPDTTDPTEPSNLILNAISENQIVLDWDTSFDSLGISGYIIYRNGEYYTSCDSNYFIDTGLISNTTYNYKVRAYDYSGNVSTFTNTSSTNICTDIDAIHSNNEYSLCPGDTIMVHTQITDFDYNYKWQFQHVSGWQNVNDDETIINSTTPQISLLNITNEAYTGNYRLSIENLCGKHYSDPILINLSDQYSIWGTVTAGNQSVDSGFVYLYNVEEPEPVLVDEFELFGGYYHFGNICPGEYIIKAIPQGSIAQEYAPRFYIDGWTFNTAERLSVDTDMGYVNIHLKPIALGLDAKGKTDFVFSAAIIDDNLHVAIEDILTQDVHVSVINTVGYVVKSGLINKGQSEAVFDIAELPAGIYYILFRGGDKLNHTQKILVQ